MQTIGATTRTRRKLSKPFSKRLGLNERIRSAKRNGDTSIRTRNIPETLIKEFKDTGYGVSLVGKSKEEKNQISWDA